MPIRLRRPPLGFVLGIWLAVVSLPVAPGAMAATATPVTSPEAEDGYARPDWLAEAEWLKEHLGDANLRAVALTPADEFVAGHPTGASQIDWPDLEVTDTSDPAIGRWQDEVERKLTWLWITPANRVVIYDGGTLYAPRLWWVLHQLGHADKRVLNGGLPAWTAAGGGLETGPSRVEPAVTPYRGAPQPAVLAQLAEVEAALDDPGVALVDARSAEEYAAGHIPGAVHVEFTTNALPNAPKYWKPAAELRALYDGLGVTPDKRVIPYCTTGVRSAVTYFTLGLLGYDDVALFTGSWAEWSAHPELPKATGPNP